MRKSLSMLKRIWKIFANISSFLCIWGLSFVLILGYGAQKLSKEEQEILKEKVDNLSFDDPALYLIGGLSLYVALMIWGFIKIPDIELKFKREKKQTVKPKKIKPPKEPKVKSRLRQILEDVKLWGQLFICAVIGGWCIWMIIEATWQIILKFIGFLIIFVVMIFLMSFCKEDSSPKRP